jgi:hypothetical protein
MTPAPTDRRRAHRVPVCLPLRIRIWRFGLPEQHAECLNISASGAYFATGSSFHQGDRVEMDVRMPEAVVGRPSTWHCEGRVVRVERLDSGSRILGVGVEFDRYGMQADALVPAACPDAA